MPKANCVALIVLFECKRPCARSSLTAFKKGSNSEPREKRLALIMLYHFALRLNLMY